MLRNIVLVLCFTIAITSCNSQVIASDNDRPVHQLLDSLEQAWQDRDLSRLDGHLHKDLLAIVAPYPGNSDGVRVTSKEDLLQSLSKAWEGNASPYHRFPGRTVTMLDDLAWLSLTTSDRYSASNHTAHQVLAMAIRNNDKWQLCFSMPRFFNVAVVVHRIEPESVASDVGIRYGDVVYACNHVKVANSNQLNQAFARHAQSEPGSQLTLTVIRDNSFVDLTIPRSEDYGVDTQDHLVPTNGALLIDVAQDHPIKAIVAEMFDAFKKNDLSRSIANMLPGSYLAIEPNDDKPSLITTWDTLPETWKKEYAEMAEAVNLDTLAVLNTQVISSDNVALATSLIALTTLKAPQRRVSLQTKTMVFVRRNNQWRMTAVLPRRFTFGANPQSPEFRTKEQTAQTKQRMSGVAPGLIGIAGSSVPQGLQIDQILPGGGADRAGLHVGEIISAVNDKSIAGLTSKQAIELIKGPNNTTVSLTILSPDGSERTVTVARGNVEVSGVTTELLPGPAGLIRVSSFNNMTAAHVRNAIDRFTEENVVGLVIDLRDGQGGNLNAIIDVIDLFVPRNRPLFLSQHISTGKITPTKSKGPQYTDLPLAVFINQGSQGELVAAGLKRARRATLIGQTTPGVTQSKQLVENPDGSSELVVTTKFLLTRKIPITGQGVEPNIQLPANATDDDFTRRALEALK